MGVCVGSSAHTRGSRRNLERGDDCASATGLEAEIRFAWCRWLSLRERPDVQHEKSTTGAYGVAGPVAYGRFGTGLRQDP